MRLVSEAAIVFVASMLATGLIAAKSGVMKRKLPTPDPVPTIVHVEYVEGIRVLDVVMSDGTPCKVFTSDLGTLSAQLAVSCKIK